jgi:hypothetical protein
MRKVIYAIRIIDNFYRNRIILATKGESVARETFKKKSEFKLLEI